MRPYIDKNGHGIGTPSCPKCPGKRHPFSDRVPKSNTTVVRSTNPARTFQVGLPDNPLVGLAKSFGLWFLEGFGIAVTFQVITGNTFATGAVFFAYIVWRIVRGIGLDFIKRVGLRAVQSPTKPKPKQQETVEDYT